MSTVIETPSKEAAHASPNALSQALSFAAAQLPLRALDFPAAPADPERFSLLDCLEALELLLSSGHSSDEAAAALLWLLPEAPDEENGRPVAPRHLAPHLAAASALWRRILGNLRGILRGDCGRNEAANERKSADAHGKFDEAEALLKSLREAPAFVKTLLAVRLRTAARLRSALLKEAASNGEKPGADARPALLEALLAMAQAIAANASDLTGEALIGAVKADIRSAGLARRLLPSEMILWSATAADELPEASAEEVLSALSRFFTHANIAFCRHEHAPRTLFVLSGEKSEASCRSARGGIERLLAALAARYPAALCIRRLALEPTDPFLMALEPSTGSAWSWGVALSRNARRQMIAATPEADPLAAFLPRGPSEGASSARSQAAELAALFNKIGGL